LFEIRLGVRHIRRILISFPETPLSVVGLNTIVGHEDKIMVGAGLGIPLSLPFIKFASNEPMTLCDTYFCVD